MSLSSNEFKPLRKSQSLPYIASRNDSGVSSLTVTSGTGPGSCGILDQIDYNTLCNNHHHDHHYTHQSQYIQPSSQKYSQHHHHQRHHQHHHHHHLHQQHEKVNCQFTYNNRLVADIRQLMTLRQHYYPEGGWGWLLVAIAFTVQCLSHGLHMSIGVLITTIIATFHQNLLHAGMIGSLSICVGLFMSPVTIALCKNKSTRLLAVIGGLVTALGCLFSSFAQQFHQLFFSYGIIVGLGVGFTRDCSTIMVAQYFKKKREFVEMIIVSGSGVGIAVMSVYFQKAIDRIGWRLGLQCITATVFVTFLLGLLYRSASLYHPQRRAILHLKNQRRKVKEKNRTNNGERFFDFKTLRSKTVRIVLLSTACTAFGIYIPIVHLAQNYQSEGLQDQMLLLQVYMGIAWVLGVLVFGFLVTRNTAECRIARQYLCQVAAFMCAICMMVLSGIKESFEGYVIIVWTFGFFCGGYHYSLKMYTFERVRARNFSFAWSFVQFSQSIPLLLGVTFAEYINVNLHHKAGYLFGSISALLGSILLFLIDVHKRNISRHKHTRSNGTRHLCIAVDCPQSRKLSFSQEPDNEPVASFGNGGAALLLNSDMLVNQLSEEFMVEPIVNGAIANMASPGAAVAIDKPELTCISEEGIADMDMADNIFEDLNTFGDCITSCNKVENYLMLSEFENNLKIPSEKPTCENNTLLFQNDAKGTPVQKMGASEELVKSNTSNNTENIRNDANNC